MQREESIWLTPYHVPNKGILEWRSNKKYLHILSCTCCDHSDVRYCSFTE